MSILLQTILLLAVSNIFMTFAWYGHLGNLKHRPVWIAVLVSWGIAFFEYLVQVPANRIGHQQFGVAQLKILQEVIALTVFVPIAVFFLREPIKLDYVWASLCVLAAVFFVFRGQGRTDPPVQPSVPAAQAGAADGTTFGPP